MAANNIIIRKSTFKGNSVPGADGAGGAVYAELVPATGNLTIDNCVFEANMASLGRSGGSGGAVAIFASYNVQIRCAFGLSGNATPPLDGLTSRHTNPLGHLLVVQRANQPEHLHAKRR